VNPGERMNLGGGGRLLNELIVVNDYPTPFRNLRADLAVLSPKGRVIHRESRTFSIGADTVEKPLATGGHHGDGTKPLQAPEKGPLGDYTVRIRLYQGRKMLAENTETIPVVAKKPPQ
jgi:hypothetical protein